MMKSIDDQFTAECDEDGRAFKVFYRGQEKSRPAAILVGGEWYAFAGAVHVTGSTLFNLKVVRVEQQPITRGYR
jgi:hypothetical protein